MSLRHRLARRRIARNRRRRVSAHDEGGRGPLDDFWYQPIGAANAAGQLVNASTAMGISAVFACVRVIAEDVAGLPVHINRRRADGGRELAPDHPLTDVLTRKPNPWQSSYEWFEMMTGHAALRGNAYSLIVPGSGRAVDQLVPLHPGRMQVEQLESLRLRYTYMQPDGRKVRYTQDEVFHLRGLSTDGIVGLSPVTVAAQTMGVALAAEALAARQFSNKPMMSGVLQHPGSLSERASRNAGRSFRDAHSGEGNWFNVPVLEEGMTWASVGMNNVDAEFLLTRKFQVRDIARWFRMQPHKIGDLESATFSNIEQQAIEHVVDTLMAWLRRWETAIECQLLVRPDEFFVKFVVDALLRGTTFERFRAHGQAIKDGWKTRNEVRVLEDMNPGPPELDEFLTPLNMREGAEEEEEDDEDDDDGEPDEDAPDEGGDGEVPEALQARIGGNGYGSHH